MENNGMNNPYDDVREYIMAYLGGKAVEDTFPEANGDWFRVVDLSIFDGEDFRYRIRKDPVRTVGYRRYITEVSGRFLVGIAYEGGIEGLSFIEKHFSFRGWLDREWQYFRVEQVEQ